MTASATDSPHGSLTVVTVHGPQLLEESGRPLGELLHRTRAPVTYRRPWLQTWVQCFRDVMPWGVFVADGERLVGAALLATRRRLGVTEIVAVGHGQSDQIRLPVEDASVAPLLATAVAAQIRCVRPPWRLVVEQLPCGDAVAGELRRILPAAELRPGDASPSVLLRDGRALEDYGSRHHHKATRAVRHRLRRDGLELCIASLTSVDAISDVWQSVESTCRRRDLQLGRRSQVDDPQAGSFLREVVLRHAARGEVVLTTGFIDHRLAAYVLCFRDGPAMRMWNTRFDPAFASYGLGRLVRDAALEQALADAAIEEFDMMRGDEAYKRSTANHLVPAQHLLAWSSPVLQHGVTALRAGKAALRPLVRRLEGPR
ncbi:MAG: hypothetical protein JWM02_1827 [Frankiales bacterium]|nr:hypothetical protein [Frankiales bacterium]